MPNPFGNFSGSFGSGDIIAYLGVGNTSQYAASLKTADAQAQAFSKKVGMALNAVAVAGAVIFVGAVKAASDFESSFAGVLKTVDGLDDGFGNLTEAGEEMAQQMKDLSLTIPVSVNELNKIAELGGQLGIATEDLVSFTETIAKLGVTTDLTIEAAATEMARFVNITKQVAPEGMTAAEQIERIASTIVDLGNSSATTESEISAMAQRLGKSGSVIGLSQDQILGMSAALTSVGINAEAGGTAFSKLFIKIAAATEKGGDQLDKFAKIAGMNAKQFKEAYEKDAGGAIAKFIVGLGKVSKEGGSTFSVLEDLGMTEVRLRDSLLGASNASDIFTGALDRAKKAYKENNALTIEATKRFSTFESQLKLLKNVFVIAFVELGDRFLPKLKEFVELLTANPEKVAKFIENLGKIIIVLGGFAVIAKIVIAVNALNTAMIGLGLTAKGLAVAGGPIALLIAGMVTLYNLTNKIENRKLGELLSGESIDDHKKKIEELNAEYKRLKGSADAYSQTRMGEIRKETDLLRGKIVKLYQEQRTAKEATDKAAESMGTFEEVIKDVGSSTSTKLTPSIKDLFMAMDAATLKDSTLDKLTEYTKGIRGEFRGMPTEIKAVELSEESLNTEREKANDLLKDYNTYLEEQRKLNASAVGYLGVMTTEVMALGGASENTLAAVDLFSGSIQQLITSSLDPVSLGLSLFSIGLQSLQKPEISRSIEEISASLDMVGVSLDGIDDIIGLLPEHFNSSMVTFYQEVLDDSVERMKTASGDVYENLVRTAQWAADEIRKILASFEFGEKYNEVWLGLQEITEYALEQLELFGENFVGKQGVIDIIFESIIGGFNMLSQLDPGSLAFNQLFDQIFSSFSALNELMGPDATRELLDNWATEMSQWLVGDDLDMFNQWIEELTTLLFGVGGAAGSATDDIQRLIDTALSAGAITVGGGKLGIGGLHTGGIVTAHNGTVTAHNGLSSGSEVIAKLQRGEAVINRSVVGMHGASAFQELNRSGSLRGFGQGEKQQTQNFIYVDVHEAGPAAYAEVTEQVYPRIKDKQRNYEPGENPY